jgi:hypothetical protein
MVGGQSGKGSLHYHLAKALPVHKCTLYSTHVHTVQYTRANSAEAKFMNVPFCRGSGHNLESSQT